MNGDNQQILREIVLNPTIHGKELESIFGLSRRQLGYRISKRQDQTGRTIFEESLYRQITEFIALRPLCDS